jgi:dephospho-CoA kinase
MSPSSDAPPQHTQLARILARDGLSTADARARVAAQMPDARRRQLAGCVLDNSGSREGLEKQVAVAVARLYKGSALWGVLTSPYALLAAVTGGVALLRRLAGR